MAPPELSDADKQALVNAVAKMHESQDWKEVLTKNGWTDAYLTDAEFCTYMADQTKGVEDVLTSWDWRERGSRGCRGHLVPG